MSTITKPDRQTSLASRWWKYCRDLGQAMDFDSQAYTEASQRRLRQTVSTLEARVAELEVGRPFSVKTESNELSERGV